MDKIDFSDLLEEFAVPLEVYPLASNPTSEESGDKQLNGHWDEAGKYHVDSTKDVEPLKINEPFINDRTYLQELSYNTGGTLSDYDAVWYSSHSVPVHSRVIHNGIIYTVENVSDYTDYSNVIQYELKAGDGNQASL